ncbi:hypothetical protein NRB16_27645 [Pseudomonas sp. LJDD11]|uniref:hypothetical protein n=1 Tax=Pseudomonas sp. LJDD11 TaxID=2931984 RepID=UPI00211CEF48|nr:hypothetical protein [Pseudomonas sp. LJDD11]MCQ9427293.1 hypothetical protein [Pseudomonas sp. LJDD11]
MQAPGTPDKDDGIIRINRTEPGHIDVVLGSHPGKSLPRPLRTPRPYGLILLCALLAILSLCLMLSQLRRHTADIVPPAASLPPVAAPQLPDEASAAPVSPESEAQQ